MPSGSAGEPWEGDNPRLAIAEPWHDFVALWGACRGEAGMAHWPDAGGVGDQAAWVVESFAILSGLSARWDADARKAEGR